MIIYVTDAPVNFMICNYTNVIGTKMTRIDQGQTGGDTDLN